MRFNNYLTENIKFTEYYKSGKYYMGWVAIAFRSSNNINKDTIKSNVYVLNSKNDTWFRKTEGIAKGYGLALQDYKIVSRKPMEFGDYNVYKMAGSYIPGDDEDVTEKENFWLLIHKDYELKDVLAYINKNKSKWKP